MTKKEFIYAAKCNGGTKAESRAREYAERNPKDNYNCDDWRELFKEKTKEPIGSRRAGKTELPFGGRTTAYCGKNPKNKK